MGVNYWPRHRGLDMWRDWAPEEIDKEFAEMASIGISYARVFPRWDDFQPIDQVHEVESVAWPNPKDVAVYERLLPIFREASRDQARLGDMLAVLE